MLIKRYKPEQIVTLLRQIEVGISKGPIPEARFLDSNVYWSNGDHLPVPLPVYLLFHRPVAVDRTGPQTDAHEFAGAKATWSRQVPRPIEKTRAFDSACPLWSPDVCDDSAHIPRAVGMYRFDGQWQCF